MRRNTLLVPFLVLALIVPAGCGESNEERAARQCEGHQGVAEIEGDGDVTCNDGASFENDFDAKKKKKTSKSRVKSR